MDITREQHEKSVAGLRKLLAHAEARRHAVKALDTEILQKAEKRLVQVEQAIEKLGSLADKPKAQYARGHYIELCKERVRLQRMIGLAQSEN